VSLFEIVPNISDGRDTALLDACVKAMEGERVRVIHRTSDPVHNRSVITAVGSGSQCVAASLALARVAMRHIDLREHEGVHPRIGALDVLPFVPLRDATLDDAVTLAHRAATRIWRELDIPSYLYGAAASAPHRRLLADVRRGEFESLEMKSMAPEWQFDYGDQHHRTAGAIAIGAREVLVAFNIDLATGDLDLARAIAMRIRERDGGLKTLRALGLRLSPDRVQVSFNITNYEATPLELITELVRRIAARHGVAVARAELIGLAPLAAIERAARAYETGDR
jgi:glutamate formiminotransferase